MPPVYAEGPRVRVGSPSDSTLVSPECQQFLLLTLLGSTATLHPPNCAQGSGFLYHGSDLGSGLVTPLEERLLGLALIKTVQLPGTVVE